MAADDYLQVVKNIYRVFSSGKLNELDLYIHDDFRAGFNAYGDPRLYTQALSYYAWSQISSRRELLVVLKRDLQEWTADERLASLTFFASDPEQAVPQVVCVFEIDYVVRPTGKKVRQKKVHLWTLDSATHKAKRLEHFDDTAQVIDAFTP